VEPEGDWPAEGFCARFGEWNLKETDLLNTLQLITAKPTVYLINLTEKAFINKKNKWLLKARPDPRP